MIPTLPKEQVSLAEWAKYCYRTKATLDPIIDPKVKGEIAPECLRKFVEVAINCLKEQGSERPTMKEVVWCLEFALLQQEGSVKTVGEVVPENKELSFLGEAKSAVTKIKNFPPNPHLNRLATHPLYASLSLPYSPENTSQTRRWGKGRSLLSFSQRSPSSISLVDQLYLKHSLQYKAVLPFLLDPKSRVLWVFMLACLDIWSWNPKTPIWDLLESTLTKTIAKSVAS
ncbi:hypothetical protein L2E82_39834 [Cichorium intybus]|uniref:Uncharacterized protein n=1 Tax=Cichorium intybus TaxID=13427 RepID=A0ACB9AJB7_CICIN|nr:hypothetical protein L2E82_39834 [Cichorium intybus]